MPANGSYGSGRATPFKQAALESVAGHLIGSSCAVGRKWKRPVVVADMTCGPGVNPETGADGSPLILARHCSLTATRLKYGISFVYVDRDEVALESTRHELLQLIERRAIQGLVTCPRLNQTEAIAQIPSTAVGLAYWDPTRYNDLDLSVITSLSRQCTYMDILVTRECLAAKRMNCAGLDVTNLKEALEATGKKMLYAMKYAKWGWWSFGFASNWTKRGFQDWDFLDLNTEDGRHLLDDLDAS